MEAAAGRRVPQVGRRPGIVSSVRRSAWMFGNAAEQLLRVRMPRRREDPLTGPSSATLPGVHDQRPVAGLGDDRQVVGDEDQRQPELAAEALEQLEDLGLDHDVERGRRLVADDDGRVAGEGHRDHRALAHAARQLVRIGVGALARDADELEQLPGPALARRSCGSPRRISIGSAICSPIRRTGFSAFIAPWKTMLISRHR